MEMLRDDGIGRTGRKINECAAVYGLPGGFIISSRAFDNVAALELREARS